jgi:plastocyanin
MRSRRWIRLVAGIFGVALILSACGGDDGAGGATGEGASLTIEGFAFVPSTLQVSTGNTTITVTNNDAVTHTFTTDEELIDETIGAGETVEIPLTTAGRDSLGFHCSIHPQMTGTLEFG